MCSARTCPHEPADRLLVSGTKLRKALSENAEVAANSAAPKCSRFCAVLRQLEDDEKVEVKLSGHPPSK